MYTYVYIYIYICTYNISIYIIYYILYIYIYIARPQLYPERVLASFSLNCTISTSTLQQVWRHLFFWLTPKSIPIDIQKESEQHPKKKEEKIGLLDCLESYHAERSNRYYMVSKTSGTSVKTNVQTPTYLHKKPVFTQTSIHIQT